MEKAYLLIGFQGYMWSIRTLSGFGLKNNFTNMMMGAPIRDISQRVVNLACTSRAQRWPHNMISLEQKDV